MSDMGGTPMPRGTGVPPVGSRDGSSKQNTMRKEQEGHHDRHEGQPFTYPTLFPVSTFAAIIRRSLAAVSAAFPQVRAKSRPYCVAPTN